MKIKTLVNICKRKGVVQIYEDADGVQWLGDGSSLYPLYDMPAFTENSFCETFDITKKQREKMRFRLERYLPMGISTADIAEGEREIAAAPDLNLAIGGSVYIPYATQVGVRFLGAEYLKPLQDAQDDLLIMERMTTSGEIYFAAKVGFMVRGILLPSPILDKKLVDKVKTLAKQCEVALFNREEASL